MVPVDAMQDVELVRGLSPEQREVLTKISRKFGFRKGEYLFRLGDEAETLFVIQTGAVQLTIPLTVHGEEVEIVTEELRAGATLAWSAIIGPHVFTMNARAVSPSELLGFRRSELLEVFAAQPALGYQVMVTLAGVVGHRLVMTKAMWIRALHQHVCDKYEQEPSAP